MRLPDTRLNQLLNGIAGASVCRLEGLPDSTYVVSNSTISLKAQNDFVRGTEIEIFESDKANDYFMLNDFFEPSEIEKIYAAISARYQHLKAESDKEQERTAKVIDFIAKFGRFN